MGKGFVSKAKLQAATVFVNQALNYLDKDPENNAVKILNLADKVLPEGWYLAQRNAIRNAIEVSWERGNPATFEELFGYSSASGVPRPTNSEYIARIADRVRLDLSVS